MSQALSKASPWFSAATPFILAALSLVAFPWKNSTDASIARHNVEISTITSWMHEAQKDITTLESHVESQQKSIDAIPNLPVPDWLKQRLDKSEARQDMMLDKLQSLSEDLVRINTILKQLALRANLQATTHHTNWTNGASGDYDTETLIITRQ